MINVIKTQIKKYIPDSIYLKLMYAKVFKKKLDLKNPQTFNEKLQWLKLHDRNPLYTTLVDKYAVRSYIKEKIGEEYLIPLLGGPWKSVEEIPFDTLPDQFVLKTTHDSGGVVICRDKSAFDVEAAKKKLRKSLKTNFYYGGREWPYKNVKPQIIAEKYMEDESGEELKDYKLMCFHSKVKATLVCSDRFSDNGLKITFYDTDWKRLPFERHYPSSTVELEKPKSYEEMVQIAEKLSENMQFVRVDFYNVKGKVYFGELTFYPGSGFSAFSPSKWDEKLGQLIKLSENSGGGYLIVSQGYVMWIHKEAQGIKDYKFYCFNGKVKYLYVSQGLENHSTARISFLTPDWKTAPFCRDDYKPFDELPSKPYQYDNMLKIAEKLSCEFKFLRVDLYEINQKIYFSELTFFPCSGYMPFNPMNWDYELGKLLELS